MTKSFVYPTWPLPGDIALVNASDKGGTWIVRGQQMFRKISGPTVRQTPPISSADTQALSQTYSHVLLNVSGDLWCDAVPRRGVSLRTITETALGQAGASYRIFRPPSTIVTRAKGTNALERIQSAFEHIDSEIAERKKWLDDVAVYLGQHYNYKIHIRKLAARDVTKFCSELVAGIFKLRGIEPFSDVVPARVLPNDIEKMLIGSISGRTGWSEITGGFTEYLRTESGRPSSGLSPEEARTLYLNAYKISTRLRLRSVEITIIEVRKAMLFYTLRLKSAGTRTTSIEHKQLDDAMKVAAQVLKEVSSLDIFFHKAAPFLMGASFKKEVGAVRRRLEKVLRDAQRLTRRRSR